MIHDQIMKQRFNLFWRAGIYYCEDTMTGKQLSLRTKDEAEARTLLNAKNESFRQPVLNRQIARTNLAATDSAMAERSERSQPHVRASAATFFGKLVAMSHPFSGFCLDG
jgi:hypothetical protein